MNRRIALSFILAILLISMGFALSFYSYTQSQAANERIAHTFRVINSLEDVFSMAKDIESGTRGYMVIRDSLFLEPRNAALVQLGPKLEQFRKLVADNPQQQQAVDTLTKLINAKIEISDRQVRLSPEADISIRLAYLLTGKVRMDAIRQHVAHMTAIEQSFMLQRGDEARQSFKNTLVIIFALSLLTFAVLLITYNLLDQELHRRAKNESRLRQYESELQAKIQQLEESNQELERFAFVASHDMQEPLRKIQTFGDLLNQQYPPQVDNNGRLYLNKMLTSADRMSKLIRDLLSFSRLKNQPDAFQRISIGDVLDRVLVDLELPIKATNAAITAPEMPVLDAVPSQIEQLFTNLISNALKYTQAGVPPIVSIRAERVSGSSYPGLQNNQPHYQLSITDNGIGFNEKYLDRIFDVFQRLHAKADYEGTGIGLAICKRVVAYHHGYITARSQEGSGTTFIIVLPENQTNTIIGDADPVSITTQ
ncbi:CHASE3 domain-containing protein [Fibrella sp. HMF5405]|uniref:histidine kinase n=1 Tax=Fibrella forsythiae TaxID=2817061 RepID=A0ABS3JFE5_9BACT|nr:CHASE3 domain-containing protein [Fibrella forsythiae]